MEKRISEVKEHLEGLGFFVKDGIKYGIDLLVYTDHPSKVHSKYGVIIYETMSFKKLILYQRICNSNNKKLLVVVVKDDKIKYFECKRFIANQSKEKR
ncbi:hypothetical protein GINT2_000344 [Glugoides intestinalis]